LAAEERTNQPSISACLIVRDESSVLERCLVSLKGVADEIIVVDTGSADNTKEIAAKYTDKIYDFVWCDDFSAARNFANSKATGDWILTIDADEYIPEENRPLYKQAVKAVHPPPPRLRRTGGTDYLMIMPRVYMIACSREAGTGEEAKGGKGEKGSCRGAVLDPPEKAEEGVEQIFFGQRLLRRDSGIEWKGASHNVLEVPPEKCIRAEPLKVYHDRGARHNLRNLQRARQRQRMNLANLKGAVKANPNDRRSWFYLGNTYLDSGHHSSAARCYRKYLSLTKSEKGHERWQVAYYLARCYWALSRKHKESDEAKYQRILGTCRDTLLSSLLDDTERAEGYVLLGDAYIELKDYRKAIHWYACATRCGIPKQNIFFIEPSYYTWVPHFQMAQCYDSLGEPVRTRECLVNALRHAPEREEILLSLARTDQILEGKDGVKVPCEVMADGRTIRHVHKGRRKNLAVFATQDSFIAPAIEHWMKHYNIYVYQRTGFSAYGLLRWADIAFVEWGAEQLALITQLPKLCRIVARVHSYEAYAGLLQRVDWSKVDDVIFVAPHVLDLAESRVDFGDTRIHLSRVGVDLDRFTIQTENKSGNRVCTAGYLNHKKDPVFGLQVFAELLKARPDLENHIAGTHQDPWTEVAMRHYLHELGIEDHVILHPWQQDMNEFFADKDYFLSCSLSEGLHCTLAESMAAGLMPLIRSWKGARELYPEEFIFTTPAEARGMIDAQQPDPARSRDFIALNWPESRMLQELDAILEA